MPLHFLLRNALCWYRAHGLYVNSCTGLSHGQCHCVAVNRVNHSWYFGAPCQNLAPVSALALAFAAIFEFVPALARDLVALSAGTLPSPALRFGAAAVLRSGLDLAFSGEPASPAAPSLPGCGWLLSGCRPAHRPRQLRRRPPVVFYQASLSFLQGTIAQASSTLYWRL